MFLKLKSHVTSCCSHLVHKTEVRDVIQHGVLEASLCYMCLTLLAVVQPRLRLLVHEELRAAVLQVLSQSEENVKKVSKSRKSLRTHRIYEFK